MLMDGFWSGVSRSTTFGPGSVGLSFGSFVLGLTYSLIEPQYTRMNATQSSEIRPAE